jgi:hypothetical protein
MFHAIAKLISFSAALTLSGALGLAAALFGVGYASAGTITGTSQTFDSEIRQRLNAYEDWAVWNAGTLQANVTSGGGRINYSLTASSPATPLARDPGVAIFNTGNGYYVGGLSYVTNSAEGKGFTLTVPAQYANGSRLDLWLMTNGPVSADITASSLSGSGTTVSLSPYQNYIVSFTSSGLTEDLTVSMVGRGNFNSAQGQMSFGAAALTPVSVPEPDLWIPLLMLIGGFLAYKIVEAIWWFYDTVRRLEDDFESLRIPEGDLEDRWLP